MALSQIIGLVLVVIGVVMYAFSIWGYYQKRTQNAAKRALGNQGNARSPDQTAGGICEVFR